LDNSKICLSLLQRQQSVAISNVKENVKDLTEALEYHHTPNQSGKYRIIDDFR